MLTGQETDIRRYSWLRRPLFWVITSFLLFVLLVTFVVVMFNRAVQSNQMQRDRQHEAIKSFVAPSDWRETSPGSSGSQHSKHPCFIRSLCDLYRSRRWETTEPQSGATLRALAEAAGWEQIRFVADTLHPEACREDGEGSYWCPLHAVSGKVAFELGAEKNDNYESLWRVWLSAH